jgi:hypothetical protein
VITAGSFLRDHPVQVRARAYIESQGYDQFSDLLGGFADKTFKMPNPNYYLP